MNYLLQRIETYDGVTVLTSNFPENIDDAFVRRIKVRVEFPFPGPEERTKLWKIMIPAAAEMAGDVDFVRLAKVFELAGGSIKNAVVRAAFMAAERGTPITMGLFEEAGILECKESGKLVRFAEGRPIPAAGERRPERARDEPVPAPRPTT